MFKKFAVVWSVLNVDKQEQCMIAPETASRTVRLMRS